MKIAIGSDFSAYRLKEAIKRHLISLGYEVDDLGQQHENDKVFYYEAASSIARAVQQGVYEKAVLCCGTGGGVSIVANKFKGIYAVACESIFTGEYCALVNDANIITVGARVVGEGNACSIIEKWLDTKFLAGLTPERQESIKNGINMVKKMEDENFV